MFIGLFYKILSICAFIILILGCAKKGDLVSNRQIQCSSYQSYASVSFDVAGDMAVLVEKSAKKALARSCYKKSDDSNSNLRIKIESKAVMKKETGFIKDKIDNTLHIMITAIMLMPTDDGGLTTLTSKQEAKLNLKSEPIADIGNKSEIKDEDVVPFVESNVLVALDNLMRSIKTTQ